MEGKCRQGSSSGSRLSPDIAKDFRCSALRATTALLEAQGAPCTAGCSIQTSVPNAKQGVLGVWELSSTPPARTSLVLGSKTRIQPGSALPMGHVPSPGCSVGAAPSAQHLQPPLGEAPALDGMETCLISAGKSSSSSRGPGSPCQANMFKSNRSFLTPKFTRCFFQTLIKPFCRRLHCLPPVPGLRDATRSRSCGFSELQGLLLKPYMH